MQQNKKQKLIKAILAHERVDKALLEGDYLQKHLESINCEDNLSQILAKLN